MAVLAVNKQAAYDYEILSTLEAGIILSGAEVKSVKNGQVNLRGSYVSRRYRDGRPEFYLLGAHIAHYQYAGHGDYDPIRQRQLLLKKEELRYLTGKMQEKGLTLIPVKIYTKNGLVKVELALARGRKKYDKRESIKRRDIDRDIKRTLKNK